MEDILKNIKVDAEGLRIRAGRPEDLDISKLKMPLKP